MKFNTFFKHKVQWQVQDYEQIFNRALKNCLCAGLIPTNCQSLLFRTKCMTSIHLWITSQVVIKKTLLAIDTIDIRIQTCRLQIDQKLYTLWRSGWFILFKCKGYWITVVTLALDFLLYYHWQRELHCWHLVYLWRMFCEKVYAMLTQHALLDGTTFCSSICFANSKQTFKLRLQTPFVFW